MRTDRAAPRAALGWFLAAEAIALAAATVLPWPSATLLAAAGVQALTVLAVLAGVRWHRPDRALAWLLIAAGQAGFTVGVAIFLGTVGDAGFGTTPAVADAFFLPAHLLHIAGLMMLLRARTPSRDTGGVLDTLLTTVGVAILAWEFLIRPRLITSYGGPFRELLPASYPAVDILLAAVLARLSFDRGARPRAYWLLVGAYLPLIAADTLYAVDLGIGGDAAPTAVAGFGWVACAVGLGMAALHPSMAELDRPGRPAGQLLTTLRIAGPLTLPILAITLALLFDEGFGPDTAPAVVIGTMMLLCLLLVLRVTGVMQQLRAVAAQNAQLHREAAEARFRQLIQNTSDVITVLDADRLIRYQTPSVQRVLGYRPDELLGTQLSALMHPEDTAVAAAAVVAYLTDPYEPLRLEYRLRRKDGSYMHAEAVSTAVAGPPMQHVLTIRDVTERHQLQQQLRHQAFHDALTGLANRELFLDRVRHALARRGLADAPLAVLFLDLDDFRTVNDSLGHQAGDSYLVVVADRLREVLRPSDTAARLGGDEFAVLLEDLTGPGEATVIADRVLAALRQPFQLDGRDVAGRASIGVARVDLDRAPVAEDLLRDAEAAMYAAKAQGKGGHAVFTPDMHAALLRRLQLTAELEPALAAGQFRVHYQPVVALSDGRIAGVEALLRWQHPEHGMISPVEFIPLAEQGGQIVPIGHWVLAQACADGARWQRVLPMTIGVNLSLRQLREPGLVAGVAAVLADTGLPSDRLTLEITESFLLEDAESEHTIDTLRRLKALGLRLVIDDFGTGYSSLSRLRQFPIDGLKIPKPFVDGLLLGGDHAAVARTITDLALTLGLDVVAEGIEHREQWVALRRISCGYGQGFLFARPVPAAEIDPMLARGRLTGSTGTVRPLRPRSA